jgi:hypothetical protein
MYPKEMIRDEREVLKEQVAMQSGEISRLQGQINGMWEMLEALKGIKRPMPKNY